MYSFNKRFIRVLTVALLSSGVLVSAVAGADTSEQRLEKALQFYQLRSSTDPAPIENALRELGQAEKEASDEELKYRVLILESRSLYWKGIHLANQNEKVDVFALGQEKAEAAIHLNEHYADGYYYAGINLARWGEAKGVIQALFKKDLLLSYMSRAMETVTMEGEDGESIDYYGPHRVLGRLYFKVPAIFGGSHSESIKHLELAYRMGKICALNVIFYAETLSGGNEGERTFARRILDELLTHRPEEYRDRVPEAMDEFSLAQKLRQELG